MKAALKKIGNQLKMARFIGKPVRFAIAFYRIPTSRLQLIGVLESVARLESAYKDQLPALLETVSRLNHRQFEIDRDLPAVLDKLRQDMNLIRSEIQQLRQEERPIIEGLLQNVDYLLKRVEFVRRELMFEMRNGASNICSNGNAIEVQPKVIAANKVAAARASKLRLNLGCGQIPLAGYLNIDRRELPGVDIIAEVDNLPFKPGEVDEIQAVHLLEHFPQEQLKRQLLPYWKSLLRPGGVFRAVVPDVEAMIREYSAGRYSYEYMRQIFFGAQEYGGDFHRNMFIPVHMSALLTEAGFVEQKLIEAGRRNDICFEFEVEARCPLNS